MAKNSNNYNGWTNYATWRVNLEMVDGLTLEYFTDSFSRAYGDDKESPALDHFLRSADRVVDVGESIEEHVRSIMDEAPDGLVKDYARVFILDVNWYEIAEHLIEDQGSL